MKRWIQIVVSALVFGLLAGGVMVGLNVAADGMINSAGQAAIQESQAVQDVPEETEAPTREAAEETEKSSDSTATKSTVLDVSDIVEEAMPQVVSITNTMLITQRGYSSIFDYFYGGGGQTYQYEVPASGSGIIVQENDNELMIVTNNHVVADSSELQVTFIDGTTVDAEINGTDSNMDVAVITVNKADIPEETLKAIKVAKLHTDEDLKVGQGVIAIGNALGYGQSVTVGYISALDRTIQTEEGSNEGLIQVDAAINPGNSGGALINMDGEVIGINVAKYADTEVEGIGYSIPIYKAMTVINNLSKEKIPEAEQGSLGVYITSVSDSASQLYGMPEGALITGFSDEEMEGYEDVELTPSAAKDAGLRKNDIITGIEGQKISSADELQSLVKYYAAGDTVTITYQRITDGEWQESSAEVKLNAKAASQAADQGSNGSGNSGSPDLGVPDNGLSGNGSENGSKNGSDSGEGSGTEGSQDGGAGSDNGGSQPEEGNDQENGDGSEDAEGSTGDPLYDLFRQFLDQYGN